MLMWRLNGKQWLHVPEGGQGSPISAYWIFLSDVLDVHWGDRKKVSSSQELQLDFSPPSIAPKFRFASWIVPTGSLMLERAMRALLRADSALAPQCSGLCPVGSWNSQGRRLHSPSGLLLQSLVIPKGKKELAGASSGSRNGLLFCWAQSLVLLSLVWSWMSQALA